MRDLRLLGALLLASCNESLTPVRPVVARVTVLPDTATVTTGGALQLAAALFDAEGHPLTGRSVIWSSSDPPFAAVSAAGLVTGLAHGRSTITAASGRASGSAEIKVFAPVNFVTVDQGDQTIVVGGAVRLSATARDWRGTRLAGRPLTWSSLDPGTAAVAPDGFVSGLAPGSATITATSEGQTGATTIDVTRVSFAALSASPAAHTCGVTAAGAAFCWGSDAVEQLGDGPAADNASPIGVRGGLGFAAVDGGGTFTCGLTPAGAAYCWGSGRSGRLGNGMIAVSAVPVPVSGGLRFTSLTTGWDHACAVTSVGAAYCWGGNGTGQVGSPGEKLTLTPARVAGAEELTSLAAGSGFTCGLARGGAVSCWGDNQLAQLGNPGVSMSGTPRPVAGGLAFAVLAAGVRHACSLTPVGAAYCWGDNSSGQLGDGSTAAAPSPVAVAGGLRFASIAAGLDFTCGATVDGEPYCWGADDSGQLGNAATTSCDGRPCSVTPARVAGGLALAAVTAGDTHACGITTSGVAYCWGRNASGQLGDGATTDRPAPVRVLGQP
ncbi:MAG TPA: Ig-like domain-containing protein [Gemmatimonadales bacterium]|nr:Ig-like domain-containing protein [Gemmatimonadales bacterium]